MISVWGGCSNTVRRNNSKMRYLLNLTAITASLVLLCVSLLGFAGSVFWLFDLFNHFRVQYLVASLLGLFLAFVLRSKRLTWAFICIALFNGFFIVPLYFPRPEKPKFLHEVSIVSYNTWRYNGDWASVFIVLEEDDPDIAYFTEVHSSIRTRISELESEFHIFQIGSDVLLVRRTARLSPKIIDGSVGHRISGIPVTLSVAGIDVALLAVHPAAPRSDITAGQRDQSFAAIASFVENYEGFVIVCGDLNATPWSHAFRVLQERTGLLNSQKSFGLQSTWPSYPGSKFNWLFRIPIDHCLHSPAIYTIDRRIGLARQSNHSPISLRLGIPTGAEQDSAHQSTTAP